MAGVLPCFFSIKLWAAWEMWSVLVMCFLFFAKDLPFLLKQAVLSRSLLHKPSMLLILISS